MKKIFVIACLILTACGKAKPKDVPQGKTDAGVGPYDLVLSAETESKANAFSASINQDEGKVDFYLPNGDASQYLVLHSFQAQVAGCNANGVQAIPVWYTSESNTSGDLVAAGSTLITTPRTRSLLRMVFRGMKGCTQLNFSMVVRKLEVGVLQPMLDTAVAGAWRYSSGSHSITLYNGTSSVGWLEQKGSSFTCDTDMFPTGSAFAGGGWLVFRGGEMICKYAYSPNKLDLTLNCWGNNSWGCSVPQNFKFIKQ